jgi:hypothetical protein
LCFEKEKADENWISKIPVRGEIINNNNRSHKGTTQFKHE